MIQTRIHEKKCDKKTVDDKFFWVLELKKKKRNSLFNTARRTKSHVMWIIVNLFKPYRILYTLRCVHPIVQFVCNIYIEVTSAADKLM